MTHPLFAHARPLIIAHRGARAYAPENTLAAFTAAVELGADGVELDAKLSADGHIIVIHDQTVTRTTGATGRVRDLSLAQLRALDAGSFFAPRFSGEKIPLLAEVFEAVGGKCLIDIEITNYAAPGDGLASKIAALVQQYHLEESVFFSSFLPTNLFTTRKLLPEIPTGMLSLAGAAGAVSRGWLGRKAAPQLALPYFTSVDHGYTQKEHQRGRWVIPWTVNQLEDARRLLACGVDGIITDDPLLLRNVQEK